jgi:hypothetical protein
MTLSNKDLGSKYGFLPCVRDVQGAMQCFDEVEIPSV